VGVYIEQEEAVGVDAWNALWLRVELCCRHRAKIGSANLALHIPKAVCLLNVRERAGSSEWYLNAYTELIWGLDL
jgi:hypothetical protein